MSGPTSSPSPRPAAAPMCCKPVHTRTTPTPTACAHNWRLQGVESKVQKVSVNSDTWHRIRIGPISNLDELNRLRGILRKADVDALVIRVGD